jgi:hypothetical protein
MRRLRDPWLGACTVLCILCAVVTAVVGLTVIDFNAQNEQITEQADQLEQQAAAIRAEAYNRRDENCDLSERLERAAVNALRRQYDYLRLLPEERDPRLARVIVRGLPAARKEARAARAQPYCNKPMVGLPEPGPKLPKKRDFSHLLNE